MTPPKIDKAMVQPIDRNAIPEKLEPDTTYLPARLIVDRIKLQKALDNLDEAIAAAVKVWQDLDKLINTGTTPEKE